MHLRSTLLLALPLLAGVSAQEQQQNPLGSLFNKLSSYIPAAPSKGPIEAGAAKVAEYKVTTLKERNWRAVLTSGQRKKSPAATEEWWVFLTGDNKTCFGQCWGVERAWNESVALLSVTPSPPHLAQIDCEHTPILCNSWGAGPPSIWHFLVPNAQDLPTTIRILPLNTSTTSAKDIANIHTSQTWKDQPVYEGPFHPFDGWIQQYGLSLPLAYVLWAFATLPSWAFLIVISFLSRNLMGRRINPQGAPPAAGGRPAQ